jgi:hypothetical protein
MELNSKRPQVRSWRPVGPQMCRGRVAVNARIGVVIKENLREGDFKLLIRSSMSRNLFNHAESLLAQQHHGID